MGNSKVQQPSKHRTLNGGKTRDNPAARSTVHYGNTVHQCTEVVTSTERPSTGVTRGHFRFSSMLGPDEEQYCIFRETSLLLSSNLLSMPVYRNKSNEISGSLTATVFNICIHDLLQNS